MQIRNMQMMLKGKSKEERIDTLMLNWETNSRTKIVFKKVEF